MHHKSLFPPLPQFPPLNAHHLFLNRPEQADWPDFPLHVNASTGETRSFRQFIDIVRDGATAIGSDIERGGLGIGPGCGELVGVLSENCMDCIALIHSLLVLTVPFAMFSGYSTPFEFQHSFKLVAATRLFVTPTLLSLALTSGLPDDRIYILDGSIKGHTSYSHLVARARSNSMPRLPVQPAQNDTLAYLMFSSGTTGLPKAIMVSHGNLTASICQTFVFFAETLKVVDKPQWNGPGGMNVIFSVLPIFHTTGLHTAAVALLAPSTLLLLPRWSPDAFLDCIPKYRVTTMYLVPSLVHQIVHHPRFSTTDFSTVQSVNCGAAYLPVSLSERLLSRFHGVERMGEGYGLSECTVAASLKLIPGMLDGRAKNIPNSVGMLLPGTEARVLREDGQLAAVNEPGELYIRSNTVALGYWNNKKATDETFVDGWLRTGDRMRIDADGVLYFEDRTKDTLKVSGMQVSPTEIEETLRMHPEKLFVDVAVSGVSGGRTSDERVPRAWIVLSQRGKDLSATEVAARLDAWIREKLSRYKWLRGGVGVVDQIPKSPTGKVLRRKLVDEYETGLLRHGAKL